MSSRNEYVFLPFCFALSTCSFLSIPFVFLSLSWFSFWALLERGRVGVVRSRLQRKEGESGRRRGREGRRRRRGGGGEEEGKRRGRGGGGEGDSRDAFIHS